MRFLAAAISFSILRETEEGNKSERKWASKWAGNAERSPPSLPPSPGTALRWRSASPAHADGCSEKLLLCSLPASSEKFHS